MREILHLSTGGTITGCESDYPAISKIAAFFKDAVDIGKYMKEALKVSADYSIREVCNKDSRDMTDDDRKILKSEIERAYNEGIKHFLITHGTYTMPETGVYLLDNLSEGILKDTSIILTGAMYPMNLFGGDGLMNLGASVSVLINSDKPLGVKLNFHGKNWDPRHTKKDDRNLIFKEV